jgi:polyhydroxybutyrate depolymerase
MTRRFQTAIRVIAALVLAIVGAAAWSMPAAAAPCARDCLTPGDYSITTIHGGLPRNYLVHVPASYDGSRAVPLMVDFHGFSKDAWNERTYSGQLRESDERGFIVVWPNGVGLAWNAYGCCFLADAAALDDTSFVRALVTAMKARANIDDTRVFATGISNGGGMAHRIACEAADVFRAAVAVSYPLNTDRCRPSRPIHVTAIAGTADETISYYGSETPLPLLGNHPAGVPLGVQGARESFAAWKRINGCSDKLARTPLPQGSRWEEYADCAGGVRTGLVTIADGPHVLYNGYKPLTGIGVPGWAPIDVADWMWTNILNL